MKVGSITGVNPKGQIVIPKQIRDALGIQPGVYLNVLVRGSGIYLYPIIEALSPVEREGSYSAVLQKTKGAWGKDDWNSLRTKRRSIELKASAKRKQPWYL